MDPIFKKQPKGFATKAIHFAQEAEQWAGQPVVQPIVTSVTFKQDAPGVYKLYEHSRASNPTRLVLEQVIASLDNAKYGVALASGTGACATVLHLLKSGDHIICGDDIYGGTHDLITKTASRIGLEVSFIDTTNLENVKPAIKKNTKLVFVETPTNPTMKVTDIEALCKICHQHENVIVAIDNTYLTPYFQRPLDLGADIVVSSLTKYMNGHNDIFMGGITTNSEEIFKQFKEIQNGIGVIPSPFDCYQVNRGLKTLVVRMEQHQRNGIAIAKYLENHPFVARVLHPGLPSHPQHDITLKQTYGHSGVFAFYLKRNIEQTKAFLCALKVISLGPSLGGVESLIMMPVIMSHANVPVEEREKLGITDTLIRISVGLEDVDDLIADIEEALTVAQKI